MASYESIEEDLLLAVFRNRSNKRTGRLSSRLGFPTNMRSVVKTKMHASKP
jgi:hypothetical protein